MNNWVKKVVVSGVALALAFCLLSMVSCSKSASLKLDKKVYAPAEKITVTFTAPAGYPEKAWIGVIPSEIGHGSEETNDANDVSYQYLNKMTSGTLTFNAPDKPGSWDLRMNDSDASGKETASVTFTVK